MIKPLTVPFGQRVEVNVGGQYLLIREASSSFQVKVSGGNERRTYTMEGGDEIKVEGGFRKLLFINLSAEDDLKVDFLTGNEPFNIDYVKLPRTRLVGYNDISLATDETRDFPGIDENGKRRKQFTVTVGPDIQGAVLVFDADDDTLLAIISANETAGVGFAIETDTNLRIKNCTDENPLKSTGPNLAANMILENPTGSTIAIAETFYR